MNKHLNDCWKNVCLSSINIRLILWYFIIQIVRLLSDYDTLCVKLRTNYRSESLKCENQRIINEFNREKQRILELWSDVCDMANPSRGGHAFILNESDCGLCDRVFYNCSSSVRVEHHTHTNKLSINNAQWQMIDVIKHYITISRLGWCGPFNCYRALAAAAAGGRWTAGSTRGRSPPIAPVCEGCCRRPSRRRQWGRVRACAPDSVRGSNEHNGKQIVREGIIALYCLLIQ